MTSIHDCIQRAIDAKDLNPVLGRAAQSQYDQLVARYEQIMTPHQAAASAAADLKEATRKAARSRFHAVVNQLQAMRRLQAQVAGAPDPALALRNLIEWSEGSGFSGESIRSLTEAYVASVNAGLTEVLDRIGLNMVGSSRDRILAEQIIDALHGDKVANQDAVRLADAIRYQQKRMRQMFNAHGGDIGELADYGIAHSHSPEQILKAGFDAWAAKIETHLAWDRIDDASTGRPFASQAGTVPRRTVTQRFLRDVYEGIISRGWDDRAPAMTAGAKALYNRRAEHRVLHFKSGADWRAYNAEFGAADPFSAMMNGLHGLARDVAMMRVLGPNPRLGLEFAIQVARKKVAGNGSAEARVQRAAGLTRTMFAHVSGAANVPEHIGMARFFSGTRGFLTSVQLGSAVLSSVSDMATVGVAARVMGMNPANVAARTVRLVASRATRQEAARMGYVAQTLAEAGGGSARYFGELIGTGITSRLSGFVLRASGLSFLTDMRRLAFQTEFAGHLAGQADNAFADLPLPLRRMFQARGIGPADWDALRDPASRFIANNGADFIAPDWWLEHQVGMPRAEAEGLAMRLRMLTAEQMEIAIPSASIEGKARLQGAAAPGTLSGELLRSSTSYKSFAMSLMLSQYRRFLAQPDPMSKATYAASISGLLLLTGAMAIQLKEIAKGRDPRPMTDAVFWKAALLQGGGLGIFGDFFAAEQSRAGGGLGETLAGPVVGLAGDVLSAVAPNVSAVIAGKPSAFGRDAANLVRYNSPVGSSMWWGRLAYDRLVADNLQRFLDPKAEKSFQDFEKRQVRDYGNRAWWSRGEPAPSRAPSLSNALETRP